MSQCEHGNPLLQCGECDTIEIQSLRLRLSRAERVIEAVEEQRALIERIAKAGRPPHTDYWHQSLDEAKWKVMRALAEWREGER